MFAASFLPQPSYPRILPFVSLYPTVSPFVTLSRRRGPSRKPVYHGPVRHRRRPSFTVASFFPRPDFFPRADNFCGYTALSSSTSYPCPSVCSLHWVRAPKRGDGCRSETVVNIKRTKTRGTQRQREKIQERDTLRG